MVRVSVRLSLISAEYVIEYSSILLHVGTNHGHLANFRLLPESNGRYAVHYAGSMSFNDHIVRIAPLVAETGRPAYASQSAVANLRHGTKVNGVLLVATQSEVRILKPISSKGAHKTWDEFLCHSAAVVKVEDKGYALVGLFGDGSARAYSIPALKEIGLARLNHTFDVRRLSEAVITSTGDILGWTGPSEMALLNFCGTGSRLNRAKDALFDPESQVPPRPTISNLQWISGTQYITPTDLDILIGGPDRPPSKRMVAQARADEQQRRAQGRATGQAPASSSAAQQDEGYWAYMQRQINERTQNLGIMGDNMDRLESNSAGWADDVSKFVSKQKKNLVMGGG